MNNWVKSIGLTAIKLLTLVVSFGSLMISCQKPEPALSPGFSKTILFTDFYAEGSGIGDINLDGQPDIVAGPFWFKGPDFKQKTAFYLPEFFDKKIEYSDNFVVAIDDVDDDGMNDILVVGFPGDSAYWYKNPGKQPGYWERHLIHSKVDNESPTFYDLTGDGKLELVFHTDGFLGFASGNPREPAQTWKFHRISEQQDWGKFTHGLGLGDVNGDNTIDILKNDGWWANPGMDNLYSTWTHHPVDFGPGGAQMHVYDVDRDGTNDVISSLDAHGWGLAWFKHLRLGDQVRFEKNVIMGSSKQDNPYGVRFSQPHALQLVDLDHDGIKDLVVGKRVWTRGPQEGWEPDAPAVVYWFKLAYREGSPYFIPFQVDASSGVGVDFAVGDLNGDMKPDIVTCNKNGAFVFLNELVN